VYSKPIRTAARVDAAAHAGVTLHSKTL